jgi:hypothetical protein
MLFTEFALATIEAANTVVFALRRAGIYVDLLGLKYEKLAATAQLALKVTTLGLFGDDMEASFKRYGDAQEKGMELFDKLNALNKEDDDRKKAAKDRNIGAAMSRAEPEDPLYSTGPEGDAAEIERQRKAARRARAASGQSYASAYEEQQVSDRELTSGSNYGTQPLKPEGPEAVSSAPAPDPQVALLLAAQNAELSSQTVLLSTIADRISSQKTDAE